MKIDRRNFLFASSSALLLTQGSNSINAQNRRTPKPSKILSAGGRQITVHTTAKDTSLRLSAAGPLMFKPLGQPSEAQTCVFVDPTKSFQSFIGIGGAITDASAETFSKLPKDKQAEILKAYFDPHDGIGYTLARTNIHSCDFSSGSYTYVNEGDKDLKTFSVDHDKQYRIPFVKQAITATNGALKLFASPWSPPAFMKSNNDMLHGGKLKPEYHQSWANYFARFIKAYQHEGMPVWGITIQNEPMATQRWESCIYTAEEERDFLKNFLGPTMRREGLSDVKIIAWDHNRDLIYQRASTMLNDPEAAKYVWGIGYHWYEPWSGGDMMFDNVRLVHDTFPDKQLLFTEGCAEAFKTERINDWTLGERYGYSMIHDFNCGTTGWTDWNILLDERGGPNHVNNFCFAPLHADTITGKLMYTNSFYYIGHFSKFIRPGAKRIASSPSRSSLLSTAFVNPDGKVATIVMNKGEKEIPYYLWIDGQAAEVRIPPRSIQTLTF